MPCKHDTTHTHQNKQNKPFIERERERERERATDRQTDRQADRNGRVFFEKKKHAKIFHRNSPAFFTKGRQ